MARWRSSPAQYTGRQAAHISAAWRSTWKDEQVTTLYTANTASGKVSITEANVILDKPGGMTSESIPRASVARVESKTTMVSLMGFGGMKSITIYTTDGRRIELKMLPPKVAASILELLR